MNSQMTVSRSSGAFSSVGPKYASIFPPAKSVMVAFCFRLYCETRVKVWKDPDSSFEQACVEAQRCRRPSPEHGATGQTSTVDDEQPDEPLRCSNCGREPRDDENAEDEWRAGSDGVGELYVFCPECWGA
jgi:hypothetical protein